MMQAIYCDATNTLTRSELIDQCLLDLKYWQEKLVIMQDRDNIDGIKTCHLMIDHYLDKFNKLKSRHECQFSQGSSKAV